MNRLEIALELYKFGKADTIEEALKLSDEFILLEAATFKRNEARKAFRLKYPLIHDNFMPLNELKLDLEFEERTKNRLKEINDLGFIWNDDRELFAKGNHIVSMKYIDGYSDEEWMFMLTTFLEDGAIKKESMEPFEEQGTFNQHIGFTHISNGAKYIEFEMPNSKARIYLLDDIKEAEKGFKTSDIKASSENKESGLGLTIFKK
jgi:hypothetical protein